MGARHGGAWPWLDRGDGFDWLGLTSLAGPEQWDWFMGVRNPGIDLWGHVMGTRDWIGEMGLSFEGGGWGTEMEGVVDRECHWKGPEGPGRDEGGEEGVGGIG